MHAFCLRWRASVIALCALLLGLVSLPMTATSALAHPGDSSNFFANLKEYTIPTTNSYPVGITVGPDGNLWFTEHGADKVGQLTPWGTFTEYPLSSNSQPDGITSGPDGNLWFTEEGTNRIGRLTPSGVLSEYQGPIAPTPGGFSGLVAIASSPDGTLWFTEVELNKIAQITPSGTITQYAVPTANSRPTGIVVGPNGDLWFTEAAANKITHFFLTDVCHVNPKGIEYCQTVARFREYPLPAGAYDPEQIVLGSDGNLWFTQSQEGTIGRMTPSGTFTEYPVPTAGSDLTSISAGPSGVVFTESASASRLGSISYSGTITESFLLPTPTSLPLGVTFGPDGNPWFTEARANQIGHFTPPGLVP